MSAYATTYGLVCGRCAGEWVAGHVCPGEPDLSEQPVREVTLAISTGHAYADVDAVRVARAFLRMDEEGT